MRKYIILLLSIVLFSSCVSVTEKNFFVKNTEEDTVRIQYTYFETDPYKEDSVSNIYDFEPKNYVLISPQILAKKQLRRFPYKAEGLFDTLFTTEISKRTYALSIPPKSTVYISSVFKYGENIAQIVLNNTDTIRFSQEYPYVENKSIYHDRLYQYLGSFPFYMSPNSLFTIDLEELEYYLQDE